MSRTPWLLALLLMGCDVSRGLVPKECCEIYPGRPRTGTSPGQSDLWVCKDSKCPELATGTECTTLSNTEPTYCQIPTSDNCAVVYLEDSSGPGRQSFQTVYCF